MVIRCRSQTRSGVYMGDRRGIGRKGRKIEAARAGERNAQRRPEETLDKKRKTDERLYLKGHHPDFFFSGCGLYNLCISDRRTSNALPTFLLSLADDSMYAAPSFLARAWPSAAVTALNISVAREHSAGNLPLARQIRLLCHDYTWHLFQTGKIQDLVVNGLAHLKGLPRCDGEHKHVPVYSDCVLARKQGVLVLPLAEAR